MIAIALKDLVLSMGYPVALHTAASCRLRRRLSVGYVVRHLLLVAGILVSCCWAAAVQAAAPLTIGNADRYPLGRVTLEVLADPCQRLTIADVTSPRYASRFKPVAGDTPNFGITTTAYWFRFSIDFGARDAENWFLLLDHPLMDYADLYLVRPDGTFQVQHSGDMIPMSSRSIPKRAIQFAFPAGIRQATGYLRGQISGRSQFPLSVCTGEALNHNENIQNSIYAGFSGFALTIAVISLSLYLFIREKSFVYYALYILATAAYHLIVAGYLYSLVLSEHPRSHDYLATLIGLLPLLGATFFIREFLITPQNAPFMDRILRIWLWANLILPPLIFIIPAASFKALLTLDAVLIVLFLLAVSAEAVRNGYPPAKYLLASRILHEVAVLLLLLVNFNLIPYSPHYEIALLMTPLLDGILIAFAQGERFTLLSNRIRSLVTDLQLQVEERTAAHAALQEQMEEKQRLEQEIQRVSREERRRISHELHDGLCQQLTGARLRFAALEDQFSEAGLQVETQPFGNLLDESVDHAYALSRRLWTTEEHKSESSGIDLSQLAEQLSGQSGIAIKLEEHRAGDICGFTGMQQLRMIAREALINAVKHSEASQITVSLHCLPQREIKLAVCDNGIGIAAARDKGASKGGLGIAMMEYRAAKLGAQLRVTAAEGGGTCVCCTVPCTAASCREVVDV